VLLTQAYDAISTASRRYVLLRVVDLGLLSAVFTACLILLHLWWMFRECEVHLAHTGGPGAAVVGGNTSLL
jgi:hypothetical protein